MAMPFNTNIHQQPTNTHTTYRTRFYEDTIETIVTNTASIVDSWIAETQRLNSNRLHPFIIGLDVEWRPSFSNFQNPVAIIQLCVGNRCLIFQFIHCLVIPVSLINFLGNTSYTFTGVGIVSDAEKLRRSYDLVVERTVDLRIAAANLYNMREFMNAGLQQLARLVLGKVVSRPRSIAMSDWDNRFLTIAQVQYAAIDAFLSFKIGWVLITGNRN